MSINGQSETGDLLYFNPEDYHFNKKTINQPEALVAELIKDKSGEKEKFDAIFGWVAYHIKYNYNEYYSASAQPVNFKDILKNKRAICLGYATLMDSLCAIAGITNVTVFGYAKDEIFDVGDSLYMDNHAWNAVKLDDKWYLYDVTWCHGKKELQISKRSRWIYRLISKSKEKYKKKYFKKKLRRFFKNECGDIFNGKPFYYKQRFFNRLYRNWLYHYLRFFPIRVKPIYKEGFTSDYYLCDPSFFSITHFPDNPIWALGAMSNIRAFEKDSSYYFLNDNTWKKQVRSGTTCVACDEYVASDSYKKLQLLESSSLLSNPRNLFISSYTRFDMALHWHHIFSAESDSLKKMNSADSSRSNLNRSVENMQRCKKNIATDIGLQKKKNQLKEKMLLNQNSHNRIYAKKNLKNTTEQTKVQQELYNQSLHFLHDFNEKRNKTQSVRTNFKTLVPDPIPQKKIDAMHASLDKNEKKLGVLEADLEKKLNQFDSLSENISFNIWPITFRYDTLSRVFANRINMRRWHLDNYKKLVIDEGKVIDTLKRKYEHDIDFLAIQPSKKMNDLFKEIIQSMKLKHQLLKENLQTKKNLALLEDISVDEFVSCKKTFIESLTHDICWLIKNIPKEYSTIRGFELLYWKQKNLENIINEENAAERARKEEVKIELDRRYKKYNLTNSINLSLAKYNLRQIEKEKKEYLNTFKKKKK